MTPDPEMTGMIANSLGCRAGVHPGTEPAERNWFAVYTRARHEKALNLELQRRGIESFLPLRSVTRNWSDRRKTIEEPVFSCYLFVHICPEERWRVLDAPGSVHFVGRAAGSGEVINRQEIEALRRFVEHDLQIDPFPYLREGQLVRVRSGPFRGVQGLVVRKRQHCRLVVSIELMMRSVAVEIDEAQLEPV